MKKPIDDLAWSCRVTRAHPRARVTIAATGPVSERAVIDPAAATPSFALRPVPR